MKVTEKYKEAYYDVLPNRLSKIRTLESPGTYPTDHMDDGPNDDVFMTQ